MFDCRTTDNWIFKSYNTTNKLKKPEKSFIQNTTSSYQTHYVSAKNRSHLPLSKDYILKNKNFNDKTNLFPTSYVGISKLNKPNNCLHYKLRKKENNVQFSEFEKKSIKEEAELIIEKLLEEEPESMYRKSLSKDKIEEKKGPTSIDINKLKKDINPKEYIKEAFTSEPNNRNVFKSYQMQINSLGNEKNRSHLLNGVNGYELNTVKYKQLYEPFRLGKSDFNPHRKEMFEDLKTKTELEKNMFFGNVKQRYNKKTQLNYIEKISLPDIAFKETLDEKLIETVKTAMETSNTLKNHSLLFKKQQKDYFELFFK